MCSPRLISYIVIAALGIFMVSGSFGIALSMQHGDHHLCPISFMKGSVCTAFADVFALVRHHIAGFQEFTRAVVNFETMFLVSTIGLIFIVQSLFFLQKQKFLTICHSPGEKITDWFVAVPCFGFLRWFARLEKRDPRDVFRAYEIRRGYILSLSSFF